MKLTDIKNSLNEISAIGGLKQVVKGNTDRVEGIKLSKEMAQAMIDWFNSSPYGRKYPNAKKGRLNLSLGIMGHFGLDRYAKHKGAKEELKYIKDLARAMRDNVNEAKYHKSKDEAGARKAEAIHNNAYSIIDMVMDEKRDAKEVVGTMGPALINSIKATLKHKFKPLSGREEDLKSFYNELKELLKVAESLVKRPSKAGVKKLKEAHREWWNWNFGADIVLNGKFRDSLVELNERDDAGTHLDRLADLVGKAKDFFAIGKELDKGGYKKKYFYSSTMMPMYQIEIDGFKFGIINKKYVDKGDREVGSTAIGLMENLTTEGKDDFNASYSGVNINLKKGYKKHNEDDLMKLYSQIGKAVNRMKGVKSVEVVFEGTINEVKYDIGMGRKGNGLTVYNRAEEENGDYKNVAHIDNKGKIKYYDKKLPSKIKKQIEAEAKKMMEIKLEGTMKLKNLLNESFENMKVYSNPFHSPFVKENESEESNEMTNEQKGAFLEAVKAYTSFGETVYRKEGLEKVYESIRNLVETAGKNMVKETEGSFDGITVGRHVKRMNESFRIFEKTLREVHTLQQRLESTYDEIGEVLGKYYEINEVEEKVEEGNEFGAARAKAIANGDSEFEVDGKKYKVTNVDKDDKDNAKKFANESKSMKLTSMLNESFGYGELPSSKLKKMKMTFKEVLELDKDEMAKLHKDGEKIVFKNEDDVTLPDDTEFKIDLKHLLDKHKHNGMNEGFSTWEMRFSDMNLGGVKLSKKNVYKVKARNTVEAIKKAAKMAGVGDNWIATETHSLKKIG